MIWQSVDHGGVLLVTAWMLTAPVNGVAKVSGV